MRGGYGSAHHADPDRIGVRVTVRQVAVCDGLMPGAGRGALGYILFGRNF
ncbi:MAG: hypothetical protein HC911_02205 [Chloroflexaceae bacterium]|nr:hypothetical protein [Chloroflexaceae bacterium]